MDNADQTVENMKCMWMENVNVNKVMWEMDTSVSKIVDLMHLWTSMDNVNVFRGIICRITIVYQRKNVQKMKFFRMENVLVCQDTLGIHFIYVFLYLSVDLMKFSRIQNVFVRVDMKEIIMENVKRLHIVVKKKNKFMENVNV